MYTLYKYTDWDVQGMLSWLISSFFEFPSLHRFPWRFTTVEPQFHWYCFLIVKAMVSPVVMYRCESGNIKKAECQRIVFELWIWRRLLRIPWIIRRSNQSILNEINPEYSLERLMLSWSSNIWPPDGMRQFIGKDPDAGKNWRQKVKGRQKMRWLNSITDSMDMNLSKFWETVKDRGVWHVTVHWVTESQTWLSDWTKTTVAFYNRKIFQYSDMQGPSCFTTVDFSSFIYHIVLSFCALPHNRITSS